MQPLGRRYFKCPTIAKTDHHPPKGFVNWWEDVVTPNKKFARQQTKKEIIKEINGYSKNV